MLLMGRFWMFVFFLLDLLEGCAKIVGKREMLLISIPTWISFLKGSVFSRYWYYITYFGLLVWPHQEVSWALLKPPPSVVLAVLTARPWVSSPARSQRSDQWGFPARFS